MQRATICLVCGNYWREYMHLCVIDGMAVAFAPHVLHSIAHLATGKATCDDAKVPGPSRDSVTHPRPIHVSLDTSNNM